jgi:hypothetical protein
MSIARPILVLICGAALLSCETASEPQSSVAEPDVTDLQAGRGHGRSFVGYWKATSFMLGEDEILRGTDLSLVATFERGGDFSVAVSGDDENEICEGSSSCDIEGTYWHTSYVLTLIDDGQGDGDAGYYVFRGNKLIYFPDDADSQGGGAKIEFVRTRRH